MKQVIQNYKSGELQLVEVPAPQLKWDSLLVRTVASLISVGTERYMLDMARKSLVGKALARPDLVRQVIAKAQAEGILEAWQQVSGESWSPFYFCTFPLSITTKRQMRCTYEHTPANRLLPPRHRLGGPPLLRVGHGLGGTGS